MKIGVVVIVYGGYINYIPYFIYSVLLSNPTYFVKVVTNVKNPVNVIKSLESVKKINKNFELVYDPTNMRQRIVGFDTYGRSYKHLMGYDLVKEFDYAYYTDVDHIWTNRETSMIERLIVHLENVGTTFYNIKRPKSKRLCNATHLVKVQPYFQKYSKQMQYYRTNINRVKKLHVIDETFLYHLMDAKEIAKNISYGPRGIYCPGFNLGVLRKDSRIPLAIMMLRNTNIKTIINCPIFKRIYQLCPVITVKKLISLNKKL